MKKPRKVSRNPRKAPVDNPYTQLGAVSKSSCKAGKKTMKGKKPGQCVSIPLDSPLATEILSRYP